MTNLRRTRLWSFPYYGNIGPPIDLGRVARLEHYPLLVITTRRTIEKRSA